MIRKRCAGLVAPAGILAALAAPPTPVPNPGIPFTREAASRFARLALACIRKEYPNKLDHVMGRGEDVQGPRSLHPAFYGCFDWHSSVHGHWMLVRLRARFPDLPEAAEIRAALDENLAPDRIAAEVAYLQRPESRSFERTYGWAWLLKLAAELRAGGDPDRARWEAALQPLARAVRDRYVAFLPLQTYPIRTGVHPNSAYGLNLALDFAQAYGDGAFESLLRERARTWFLGDRDAPLGYEPGGEDFLSPSLEEAALMGRILEPKEFHAWFARFLPRLARPGAEAVLVPARVSDRTDPKLVHLDGLNLSRARNLHGLAARLPEGGRLRRLADRHAAAAMPHLATGAYEGEHWLGTFAVAMLEAREGR